MSKYRWLRTRMGEIVYEKIFRGVLLAIRSDGQKFAVWNEPCTARTRKDLRKILDGFLNDPAMPEIASLTPEERKQRVVMFKGEKGWVEEPEP